MGGDEVIVVDTHVIIWDALRPELLSDNATKALSQANENDGILFCEISLWEIAMLVKKGRLSLGTSYQEFIRLVLLSKNYQLQGITPEIAELSTQLSEDINNDPADRIIAATSLVMGIPLITADRNLNQADSLTTIW
ncbi:MAG: type II toxin-antitoxin system VapC family toxin [Chlorobaculum sp.]|nr:type II toxin-antitoxin system VapC family toxin [Chlorobaculum sp.]